MELDPAIASHYAVADERARLVTGATGKLEYVRTREVLDRAMPAPPATVLDVGGGPGTYAAPPAIVDRDLRDGEHRNPDPVSRPEWFTTAWMHRPEELRAEIVAAGFGVDLLVGVEGPAWLLADLDQRWEDAAERERILAAVRAVEAEPSLIGASAHLLAVARTT